MERAKQPNTNDGPPEQTAQIETETGVVSATSTGISGDDGPAERPREDRAAARNRWAREGRADEASMFRDRARADYKRAHPRCKRAEAHEYAWEAAIAAFPPAGVEPLDTPIPEPAPPEPAAPGPVVSDGRIHGLGDVPEGWPELPANASLQAELSWVQANRLLVVQEQASGATVVHLDRARTPAPSLAALGWLETSIRSYAKYVDVVSRTLRDEADDQDTVKRERIAIEEIRALLEEMHEQEV